MTPTGERGEQRVTLFNGENEASVNRWTGELSSSQPSILQPSCENTSCLPPSQLSEGRRVLYSSGTSAWMMAVLEHFHHIMSSQDFCLPPLPGQTRRPVGDKRSMQLLSQGGKRISLSHFISFAFLFLFIFQLSGSVGVAGVMSSSGAAVVTLSPGRHIERQTAIHTPSLLRPI